MAYICGLLWLLVFDVYTWKHAQLLMFHVLKGTNFKLSLDSQFEVQI